MSRENLGARDVRGSGRPPVPRDHFIGKHFGQRAGQEEEDVNFLPTPKMHKKI